MQKYKAGGIERLFDEELRTEQLKKKDNPLERLREVIDIEEFRPTLEATMLNTQKKSHAGARPYDVVLMFKIMVLQRVYNISDNQVEYQIIDRNSFREFLGLRGGDKVPDAKT